MADSQATTGKWVGLIQYTVVLEKIHCYSCILHCCCSEPPSCGLQHSTI